MSTCRTCGDAIVWRREGDRNRCFDPDGKPHFDRCRPAPRTSRAMTRASGFRGPAPNRTGCSDCVPPWEVCPNGCPVEFAKAAT